MNGEQTNLNGSQERISEALTEDATVGYRPQMPLEGMWGAGQDMPQLTLRRDLEFMQTHPIISVALDYYRSGTAGAEFWGGPDPLNPKNEQGKPVSQDSRVAQFVLMQCKRFWQRGVPKLQDGGYPYGWAPGEHIYREVEGLLCWDYLKDFHPNDGYVLTTEDYRPVGLRIKNVRNSPPVDLWYATERVPAKAAWYAHRPRFNQIYGRSQLLGAWRPWRRLAWRDGTEQVIDAAVYRAGYRGPIVYHPMEDMATAQSGVPATQLDGSGLPRRSARDVARQIVEWMKAGAGITLSSAQYPQAQGGGKKWEVSWPEHVMDVRPLIEEANYLEDQIMLGIGVPPELVRPGGTGSGYSGRSIPREAFLDGQQRVAEALLQMFVEQVLRPLVFWNFGEVPFEVSCKSLLESQAGDRQGEEGEQSEQGKQQGGGQQPPEQPQQGVGQQPPQPQQQPPGAAPAMSHEPNGKMLSIVRQFMARRAA